MSNLILSQKDLKYLPYSMILEFKDMPEEAQYEFYQEMKKFKRSKVIMYLLHFFPLNVSLGYVGKWLEQFLFWITGGGFGIWWLVLLFTIPSEVKQFNRKVAQEIFRDIALKYGIKKKKYKYSPTKVSIKPKTLNLPEFDPTLPTLDHLKEGFMFDLDGKTWQIVEEYQQDFEDKNSERFFICQHDLEEKFLRYSNEGYFKKVLWSKAVNVFQIDPELEKKIRVQSNPANILYFNGHRFFKDNVEKGLVFKVSKTSPEPVGESMKTWHYFNEDRTLTLKIESYRNKLKAFQGKVIDENNITDILPYKI
ncbi:DUF4178 domain-containing protein [Flammeovirga sp. EKP202]|uniref:DUF4178 domain-containing protein n=1 Tax=Flammeovirga sp. EKP202 TaxID=2770592 RepID=UPI00166006C6|nr:DUF4178 domain-containing protein [Flammeovirga sp. EKP202]MBD0404895.1 DUF4178 domain-containing protein [Flammeovirga sp. EKP202]